jgi:hypothetical protein
LLDEASDLVLDNGRIAALHDVHTEYLPGVVVDAHNRREEARDPAIAYFDWR